jgi:putative transposase
MTNHAHLLVTPKSLQGCAGLMKAIAQLHTQYINRNYDRTGSLWEGRFRSCIVQTEDYLLTCYAYVDMNPVRAGMVASPAEYPWSSFSVNAAGAARGPITSHEEYLRLGSHARDRGERYRELVKSLSDSRIAEIRAATNGNFALGSPRFQQEVTKTLGRRALPGTPGRPRTSGESAKQRSLLWSSK